jgi:hypothetical protein
LRLIVRTILRGLGRRGRGPLLSSGGPVIASGVVAAAVLIKLGIFAVNIAINNFVGWRGAIVASGLRVGTAIIALAVSGSIARTVVAVLPAVVAIISL